jgi:valyl-tRNA synthetase
LVNAAALGTDIQLDNEDLESSFRVGRNFANKIWNAVRFALPYISAEDLERSPDDVALELTDRWILSRYSAVTAAATDSLARFRFHDAAETVYQFVWSEFCDWYLELVKERLRGDRGEASRLAAATTLSHVLEGWLRLLHPIMPFITEHLGCHLPGRTDGDTMLFGPWPAPSREWRDERAEEAVGELMELISLLRNLRSEYSIDPGRQIDISVASVSDALTEALAAEESGVNRLARLSALRREDAIPEGEPGAHGVLRSGTELFVPLRGVVDLDRERERIAADLEKLEGLLRRARQRLDDPNFTERAPTEVVEREREKRRSLEERYVRLLEKRAAFAEAR